MPDNDNFAIRVADVSRHYQMGSEVIRAVQDVSLNVRKAEFLALLGSSGSGKSTLLHLMAGLDRPPPGLSRRKDVPPVKWSRANSPTIGAKLWVWFFTRSICFRP